MTDRAEGVPTIGGRVRAVLRAHPDAVAVGLILLVAVAIRVAFTFRVPVFLLRDSVSYFLPAWDLLNGYGFDISVRRTPTYPLFLVGSMALFGEELQAIAFAQHLLGVACAVLVYILGRQTVGRVAGLIAALITAANGALLISEHYLMPETVLIFLLLLTFVVFLWAMRSGRRPAFFGAGLLLGLSLLCKPVAQVLIPVLPFVLLVNERSLRRIVLPTILIGVGLASVMLPWMIRNQLEHGSLTAAGALGQTLLARTAKHDTGFKWYDEKQADIYERREGIARQLVQNGVRQRLSDGVIYRRVQDRFGMTDAEINGFMRVLATDVILENPWYYLRGTARMTWSLLAGEPEKLSTDWKTQNARLSRDEWDDRIEHLLSRASTPQRNELERASGVVDLVQPPAWGGLMPALFVLGTVLVAASARLRPALLLSLSALALIVTCAALDGPVVRYRYPADPLIALVAAGALTWAVGRLIEATRGRSVSVAGPAPTVVPPSVVPPAAGQAPRGV
ncbi:MAG: glycosyltransferase family 39 protein [Chloroflexi bacterium]|nr:glycosyltransferase family 39 protein [Chloroflexota bacterium]